MIWQPDRFFSGQGGGPSINCLYTILNCDQFQALWILFVCANTGVQSNMFRGIKSSLIGNPRVYFYILRCVCPMNSEIREAQEKIVI